MKKILVLISIIAVSFVIGCGKALDTGETTIAEMEITEKQQEKHLSTTPVPVLDYSLERSNLIKYLDRINDPNRISYIYLVNYGKVMAFYPIKGKVTYCSSKLTTRDQVVEVGSGASGAGRTRHVMESPGLDGSYGPSEDAIFFFTTEDVLVQWRGDYMWVDQPLKLTTPPELVRTIK